MTLYKWSQTAASNATADSTCPFPEGMAPSALNDGTRGMMAAIAKHRDDISGQIATAGTSTAYTVSSFQGFDSLADMHGKQVYFTPHTTNGATVTLNVDSLGAKPLRTAPGVELLAGVMIQGTPYGAVYNNTDGAWYLKGVFGNPYNVPLLGGMDYWDTVAPNSCFIFPQGQAISRTTYATAFARWGTKYGVGDGSTTFNVPDKTGRVSAMIEAAATRLTSSYFGGDSTALGAVGGGESHRLTAGELPSITSSATQTITVSTGGQNVPTTSGSWNNASTVNISGASGNYPQGTAAVGNATSFSGSNTISVSSTNTGDNPHVTVQPTITCNYIIRII